MIAVIFEVIPTDDQRDEYLAIAQRVAFLKAIEFEWRLLCETTV